MQAGAGASWLALESVVWRYETRIRGCVPPEGACITVKFFFAKFKVAVEFEEDDKYAARHPAPSVGAK